MGSNNHRQFVLFVSTLVVGIVLFDYLTYACVSSPSPPFLHTILTIDPSLLEYNSIYQPIGYLTILPSPREPLRTYSIRFIPGGSCCMGDPSIIMDRCPSGFSALANSATDDHSGSFEPWKVRVHGGSGRCKSQQPNGPPSPTPTGIQRCSRSGHRGHRARRFRLGVNWICPSTFWCLCWMW